MEGFEEVVLPEPPRPKWIREGGDDMLVRVGALAAWPGCECRGGIITS